MLQGKYLYRIKLLNKKSRAGYSILTKHVFNKKFRNKEQRDHPTCLGQLLLLQALTL